MSLLIAVLDDHLNADVLFVIDYNRTCITWIPRDMFSLLIFDRINSAFSKGGIKLLMKGVKKLGFNEINECICIPIKTSRKLFQEVTLYVDIFEQSSYFYPIKLGQALEEGRKVVTFSPPGELLKGERIHQFLGARFRVNSKEYTDLSDFERIRRQQIFLKALIKSRFNFRLFLTGGTYYTKINQKKFLLVFKKPFDYQLYNPALYARKIRGKQILFPGLITYKTLFYILFIPKLTSSFLQLFKKNTILILKKIIKKFLQKLSNNPRWKRNFF